MDQAGTGFLLFIEILSHLILQSSAKVLLKFCIGFVENKLGMEEEEEDKEKEVS